MKRLLVPAIVLVVVALGATLLADAALFPHHTPPDALTPETMLYLDRPYRLESVPPELAGSVAIPVHRHARHPVRLQLERAGTVHLFHVEGAVAWEGWTRASFPVRLPGAKAQLTTAWSRSFPAGTHAVDPAGRGAASPIVVTGAGDVREVESMVSLLRRADFATRGVSRIGPALVAGLGAALLGLALVLLARASRRA